MLNSEKTGMELYEQFVMERLQPDSNVEIFSPLKRANMRICKNANKSRNVKVHDKIVELRSDCDLFGKHDNDMSRVVGDY